MKRATIKKGTQLTTVIGVVLSIIFALSVSSLIGLFTKDQEVISQGTIILSLSR